MKANSGKQEANPLPTKYQDQNSDTRLALLYEVSKKVSSSSRMQNLLDYVIQMIQSTLKASASSVLVVDEKSSELVFEIVGGEVGKSLCRMRISSKSSIASWVAQNGKPLIVNNVSHEKRFNNNVDTNTGFVTKSIMCVPLMVHRKTISVSEVMNKTDDTNFDENDLEAVMSVASTAAMAIENTRLQQTILEAYNSTIKALAAAIDAKDPHTRGHSQRLIDYTLIAGEAMSLPGDELGALEHSAILHNVGKIAVGDQILDKPGPLKDEE